MSSEVSTHDDAKTVTTLHIEREKLNQKITGATVVWSIALALFFEKLVDALFELMGWMEDSLSLSVFAPIVWFSVLLISIGLWCRWKRGLHELDESAGTIYYLWAQPGNRLEAHKHAIPFLRDFANDFRAIVRRFPSPNPRENSYDVSKYLDTMYAEFERSTNDDNDITCFQIVPDLIWPLAFRLGNLWLQRSDKIEFIELASGGSSKESPGESSEESPGESSEKSKEIRWQLEDLKTISSSHDNQGQSSAFYIVDYGKSDPKRPRIKRLEILKNKITGVDLKSVSPGISRVKLVLCLTDADLTEDSFAKPDFKAGPVDGGSFEVIRIVAPFTPTCRDGEEGEYPDQFAQGKIARTIMCNVNDCDGTDEKAMRVGGAQLSRDVAHVIATTLDEFPDATVELHARMPKTVALAAGLYITEVESSVKRAEAEARAKARAEAKAKAIAKAEAKMKSPACTKKSPEVRGAPTDYWTRLSLAFFDDASQKVFRIQSHELEAPAVEKPQEADPRR